MKNNTDKKYKRVHPMNFFVLFLAGIINAVGVTIFLAPVNLYDSGFSGTAMLFWELTPDELTLSFFSDRLKRTVLFIWVSKTRTFVYRVFAVCGSRVFVSFLSDHLCVSG